MFVISKLISDVEDEIAKCVRGKVYREFTFLKVGGDSQLTTKYEDELMRLMTRIIHWIGKHDYSIRPIEKVCMGYRSFAMSAHGIRGLVEVFNACAGKVYVVDSTKIRFEVIREGVIIEYKLHIFGINAEAICNLFNHFRSSYSLKKIMNVEDTIVFNYPACTAYGSFGSRYSTTRETVHKKDVLPDICDIVGGAAQEASKYIDQFIRHKKAYETHRIPYTLNLLLSGLPGTGKTSIIKALAKEYNLNVFVVNSNTNIMEFILSMPTLANESNLPSIVVLEEMDEFIRTPQKDISPDIVHDVSVKEALLQYLDGIYSVPNTITIMTTNHPERLDCRFMRKGRIDHHIIFDNIGFDDALKIRKRFGISEEEMGVMLLHDIKTDECGKYNPSDVEAACIARVREEKLP